MIGADGAEYGPVTQRQMFKWVQEGRVIGSTQVRRVGEENWATASSFLELGAADRVGNVTAEPIGDLPELEELEKRIKGGGSWLYLIAALTIINTVLALAGSNWTFVIGLSITQVFDYVAVKLVPGEFGLLAKGVVLVLDLAAVGFFVFLGVQTLRKRPWAFAVGIALYGLDTLMTLLSFSIIGIAIHGWALFRLIVGLKAAQQWKALQPDLPTNGIVEGEQLPTPSPVPSTSAGQ